MYTTHTYGTFLFPLLPPSPPLFCTDQSSFPRFFHVPISYAKRKNPPHPIVHILEGLPFFLSLFLSFFLFSVSPLQPPLLARQTDGIPPASAEKITPLTEGAAALLFVSPPPATSAKKKKEAKF